MTIESSAGSHYYAGNIYKISIKLDAAEAVKSLFST